MKKNLLSAAVIAATSALLLAGCSDPGAGGTSADPASWPDQDTDLSGTSLTIWAAQNSNTVPDSVIAGFEDLTGAEVTVETIPDPYEQGIQTKVATGDMPDLAFWQPTASQLTALNAGTNLQSLDDAPWLENVDPALRDITGLLDDTRYAALVSTPAVQGVYYNKDVFTANGVTELPTDWESFIELGRQLDSAGVTPFYEMGADRWGTQWWVQVQLADAAADGLWDRVNAGDEKFTDPTIQGAIDTYASLIDEGLFNDDIKTATFEDQGAALLAGDAAMVVQVNSFFGQLQSLSDTETLNDTIGFFPIAPSGNIGSFIPDQSNALVAFATGDAEKEAASRQLLSYWLGDGYADFVETQDTISLQPSVPTPDTVPTALVSVSESIGTSVGSMQALAIANPDLYIFLADMIQGTKTPAEVAQATQDQFAQLAKAQGADGF
ncbi:carbohydrate ABC transporter substrate-binding protein (CUT1 family) [Glaciihabitans tibetensis]|uniref:Carbohydrate ABC transporter substrate-binding protein (CUT1 family) n=1 Tax=Glaciihabitans tibetensis TaxID=1266600 RepID=A0A2T0VH45_9MICO|nr:ABC transporter substrate-binding protein [Glaciihabitans tibetensis]PRY69491.1 carbohydrate ABC transporter substrate-binding protein (CUT1 family) [Glaciihabitans tibetensis]